MALHTRSKFYYGHDVSAEMIYVDFSEGTLITDPQLTAEINIGYYSPTELAEELSRAMSVVGTQSYVWSFDRDTRIFSVSATSGFRLRVASGSHSNVDLWALLGFNNVDKTGTSITGDLASGKEYKPPFNLLDYLDPEHNNRSIEATVSETGSGRVQVTRFGSKSNIEMSINFVSNNAIGADLIEDNNHDNLDQLLLFLNDIIKKGHVEFMPDRDDTSLYYTVMLDKTEESDKGIEFKLKEDFLYGADIFRTGLLTFRVIE